MSKRERPPSKNPPKGPGQQGRNFIFVVSFPKAFFRLLDPDLWAGAVSYCVYQLECGADGTLHFQGYIECVGKKSFAQLHLLEGLESAHFEIRRGTGPQAIAYCEKKDETYVEGPWYWGEPKAPGTRSDLLEIKKKYDDGESHRKVMEDNFASFIRHGKAFREYKRDITKPRNFKSKVVLFVGPPGRGKSTLMKLIAAQLGTVYKVPQPKGSGLYFDSYDSHDVMLLDEWDGHFMKPTDFNMLCDEHECILQVHGGAGHQMVSKYIFIGSNYAPQFWWKKRNALQLKQITRRIDIIFKVGISCETCEIGAVCAHHHDKPFVVPRWDLSQMDHADVPQAQQPSRKRARPGDVYGLPPLDGG